MIRVTEVKAKELTKREMAMDWIRIVVANLIPSRRIHCGRAGRLGPHVYPSVDERTGRKKCL